MTTREMYSVKIADWVDNGDDTYLRNTFSSDLFFSVQQTGGPGTYQWFIHWAKDPACNEALKLYFYPGQGGKHEAARILCKTLLDHHKIPAFAFLDLMLDCMPDGDVKLVEKYLKGFN